ncbi:hypothetical protein AAFC00_000309 [Neodothiora populina]|uniref:Ubiquinone biosynthesis protein n=1 Tax=Neodothiora populina TaxID=2781224 RepID=A0ABR3PCG6_9PEZI
MAFQTKTTTTLRRLLQQRKRTLSTTTTTTAAASSTSQLLPRPKQSRTYHSYETPQPPPYPPVETSILSAAFTHVPSTGFTQTSLRLGALDAGYREASTNHFPRGEFELVMWHLRTQRTGLHSRVQFPSPPEEGQLGKLGVGAKVRALVLERLRGNVDALGGNTERLKEALALMSLASHVPPSLRELYLLGDEIWFLAGDNAVDASWYTKRATLASVYAATEIYQSADQSSDHKDTAEFLDRRLEEQRVLGGAWRNVKEWAAFQSMAGVNLVRNLGVRI